MAGADELGGVVEKLDSGVILSASAACGVERRAWLTGRTSRATSPVSDCPGAGARAGSSGNIPAATPGPLPAGL